jgi:hypothetical protein
LRNYPPPPLAPINRGLPLLKIFTTLRFSSEFWLSVLAEKGFSIECLELQAFLRAFEGTAFSTFHELSFTNAAFLLLTKVSFIVFTHIFVE